MPSSPSAKQQDGGVVGQQPEGSRESHQNRQSSIKQPQSKQAKAAAKSKRSAGLSSKKSPAAADTAQRSGGSSKSANELKLFQNSNLLNQPDPIEQLHEHLNELIDGTGADINNNNCKNDSLSASAANHSDLRADSGNNNNIINNAESTGGVVPNKGGEAIDRRNQSCLSLQAVADINSSQNQNSSNMRDSNQQQAMLNRRASRQNHASMAMGDKQSVATNNHMSEIFKNDMCNINSNKEGSTQDSNNAIFTVKKGVLWQQQIFDRFHLRLFSRWKKRYFILTTDYLVCFKRSSSKVGRSEMGEFLYKVS